MLDGAKINSLLLMLFLSFSVHCEFGEWKNWTTCDRPCGGGSQYRTREVNTFAAHGGEICQGDAKEVQACNPQPCPGKICYKNLEIYKYI